MKQILLNLGFVPTTGIIFLADAVEYKIHNPLAKTCYIYQVVADKHQVESHNVERCIRHCIKISDTEFRDKKTSIVIASLAIKLGGDFL